MLENDNAMLKVTLLLCIVTSVICRDCFSTTGQFPRFILEPQDAVLATVRDGEAATASIHCSHSTPDTTLTWFRDGKPLNYTNNRILLDNGTVEFRTLLANIDVTPEGVRYQCMLSNAFGSVVSRTALLQSASFGIEWDGVPSATNSIDVTLGSFILLPCDPPAANPTPNVVWTRDGEVIDTENINKYKVLAPEAGSGLIIADVVADDIGPVYQCRVTNELVSRTRNSPFSHRLNRIDRYPANLTIYDTLEDVYTLATGSDVEFTCLALANDVDILEFLFIRTDGGSVPSNVIRTSHDATSVVWRTTMRIIGVTEDNAGRYQCVVRNFNLRGNSIILGRRNFTIQVSVAPAITSVPDDTVFYTGDTETLECSATGFPAPVISYYFNASLITSGVSNGVLTLNNVTTANAGPYQCFADNVRADQSALWIVTVRDPSGPVMLAASDAYATVPENANIILTVDVSADPEPATTWRLNGGDLPAMTTASLNVVNAGACPITYRAVLTVAGFTGAHSGTYTVTVENRADSIAQSFERILEVPATINSLTGIGDYKNCIIRGWDSNLTCTFSGTPQPQFMWYTLNGDSRRNIPGSNAEYVVFTINSTETVLTIRTVGDKDDVTYGCEATNMVNGSAHIDRMELEIDVCYPPTISSSPPANSLAAVNTRHTIQCGFEGVPSPTVVWSHDGSILINGSNNVTIATGDNSTTLTITILTANDSGSYACVVSNLLGNAMASSTLTVQFPPDPPSAVMVTATTPTQISLSWTNQFNGNSRITMVTVTYQLTGSRNTTETANTITSHTINGLMPNMEYNIFLQSFNAIGASEFVNVTGMTMPLLPATVNSVTGNGIDNNCIARGQNSNLTCTYSGVPQPSILWYKDSRVNILTTDAGYVVTTTPTESVLTIRNVVSVDAGTYGCEASNTVNGTVLVDYTERNVTVCTVAENSAVRSRDLTARIIIFLSTLSIAMHN